MNTWVEALACVAVLGAAVLLAPLTLPVLLVDECVGGGADARWCARLAATGMGDSFEGWVRVTPRGRFPCAFVKRYWAAAGDMRVMTCVRFVPREADFARACKSIRGAVTPLRWRPAIVRPASPASAWADALVGLRATWAGRVEVRFTTPDGRPAPATRFPSPPEVEALVRELEAPVRLIQRAWRRHRQHRRRHAVRVIEDAVIEAWYRPGGRGYERAAVDFSSLRPSGRADAKR